MTEEGAERPAFGTLLRKLRVAARLSQEQLAERARLSVQAISALERGARHSPRADTIVLLAQTLGLGGAERTAFDAAARASVKTKVRRGPLLGEPAQQEPSFAAFAPTFATTFVGRDRELREIGDALETARCVTVWGAGGVGKTRLVIESLPALLERFEERVVFAGLASTAAGDAVADAIAAAFERTETDESKFLTQLATSLAGRRTLLVIDNCEHVIAEAARFAAAALARLPELVILCTSREPLRIGGEEIVRVESLGDADAVRLFIDRASSERGVPVRSPDDRAAIRAICRRLDGIALAIELAAARTRSMSVAEIERALDERFRLLTRGSRSLEPRQQTLRAAIGWSYGLLSATERTVYERVATINGAFSSEVAAVAAGDARVDRWAVLDAIAALVDKSIVATSQGEDGAARRFVLLDSTREFALQLSDEERADPDVDASRHRFGGWLLERARLARDTHFTGDDDARDRIDLDHVRGFLRWAIDARRDVALGVALAGTLSFLWDARSALVEGLRWIDAGLAALPPETESSEAAVLGHMGKSLLYRRMNVPFDAHESALRAYTLARSEESAAPSTRAWTALTLSQTAALVGETALAERAVAEVLADHRLLVDGEHGKALALTGAAFVALLGKSYLQARDYLQEAVAYFARLGNRRYQGSAMLDLAEIEFGLGNVARAVAIGRDATAAFLETGTTHMIGIVMTNVATYLCDAGLVDEAAAMSADALRAAVDSRLPPRVALAIEKCANVSLLRGLPAEGAAELFGYARLLLDANGVAADPFYTEQRARENVEALLADRMTEKDYAAAVARGALMTEAVAIRRALAAVTRDELASRKQGRSAKPAGETGERGSSRDVDSA